MSGPIAVRAAMIASADLVAFVPASRIIADDVLPQGMVRPAILLRSISTVERNAVKASTTRHVRERVQASYFADDARDRRTLRRLGRKAAADTFPAVEGIEHVTIIASGAGPDFTTDEMVRIGTQDFFVTYSEPR